MVAQVREALKPGRSFCFTVNNYTAEDEDLLRAMEKHDAIYLIFGREVAPNTGTPHLQGYVRFSKVKRPNAVLAIIPKGTHLENAKYSAAHNQKYCSKEGDFEVGAYDTGDRPWQ